MENKYLMRKKVILGKRVKECDLLGETFDLSKINRIKIKC